MIDSSDCDPRLLDEIDIVVDTLRAEAGVDSDSLLLVGATARDILHSALGHPFHLRRTEDTDLGIMLSEWAPFEAIQRSFPRIGANDIRYRISGVNVDVVPFGDIEDPDGVSTAHGGDHQMVVFGFEDVYRQALSLSLPSGCTIRLPTPAGYTALKLRAWIDRSHFAYAKDGPDLATAMFWYSESKSVADRLYDTDGGLEILGHVDWDTARGAARVLGSDIRALLSPANLAELAGLWRSVDSESLGRALTMPPGVNWSSDLSRRITLMNEVSIGWSAT